MISDIEILRLKAIGYAVNPVFGDGTGYITFQGEEIDPLPGEASWERAKSHAQSPDGMKATMADKQRWLIERGPSWSRVVVKAEFGSDGPTGGFVAQRKTVENGQIGSSVSANGFSPEAAVDALFWEAP